LLKNSRLLFISTAVFASVILINRRSAREIKLEPVLEIPMSISRFQILFSTVSIAFVFASLVVDKFKRQAGFGGINFTRIPQELRKSWNDLFSPATRQG
jgi:hypothetical protein